MTTGSPELEVRFGKPFVTAVLRFASLDEAIAFDVYAYLSFEGEILGASRLLHPKTIFFLRRVRFVASGRPAQ
jgi:hypothetical protein